MYYTLDIYKNGQPKQGGKSWSFEDYNSSYSLYKKVREEFIDYVLDEQKVFDNKDDVVLMTIFPNKEADDEDTSVMAGAPQTFVSLEVFQRVLDFIEKNKNKV